MRKQKEKSDDELNRFYGKKLKNKGWQTSLFDCQKH